MKFLGLGTNLGTREKNLQIAINYLNAHFELSNISSIYHTKPWGKTDQQAFINLAISIETNMNIFEVLDIILEIESRMGRERKEKWGERLIDIDILLWDNHIINESNLKIPHNFLIQRDFAMAPILEIAPDILYPPNNDKLSNYIEKLDDNQRTIIDVSNEISYIGVLNTDE